MRRTIVVLGLLFACSMAETQINNVSAPLSNRNGTFQAATVPASTSTSTMLSSAPNPSQYGQAVTLTATVTPSSANGHVEFLDGTAVLGIGTLESGQAQISTSLLPSGARALRALYQGFPGVLQSSQSSVVNQAVNALPGYGFAGAHYPVASYPSSIAVGDFNADGIADLAVAGPNSDGVSVLLGNGNGTFQAAVVYVAGGSPAAVAVGDFNADGNADLVVANYNSNNLSVLLGMGDGTFGLAVNYAAGTNPVSLVVGDFNADGKADVVVANANSATVSVLLGNGDGSFQTAVNYGAGGDPAVLAVADFNEDGIPDLVVTNNTGGGSVAVLLGKADGTFQTPVNYPLPSTSSVALAVGDFNGDGHVDVAVFRTTEVFAGVSVMVGNGDGTFTSLVNSPANSVVALGAADFNGDGKADLALSRVYSIHGGAALSVMLGNGDGSFQAAVEYSVGGSTPGSVAVGDFNRDGRADVAWGSDNNVAVLLALAPGVSTVEVLPNTGSAATQTFMGVFASTSANGYKDLAFVQILLAVAADGGGQSFCFVHYDVQGNAFWLYNDIAGHLRRACDAGYCFKFAPGVIVRAEYVGLFGHRERGAAYCQCEPGVQGGRRAQHLHTGLNPQGRGYGLGAARDVHRRSGGLREHDCCSGFRKLNEWNATDFHVDVSGRAGLCRRPVWVAAVPGGGGVRRWRAAVLFRAL